MRFLHALGRQTHAVSLAELAAASGLSEHRATVICAGLESLHLVERDGRLRRAKRALRDAELTHFLDRFSDRYAADQGRLREIMSYGESTLCRMKFIREYFGEPGGEACGHCDNCKLPVRQVVRTPRISRRVRTEVDADFRVDQLVIHARFGSGKIVESRGTELTIDFVRHGTRRVLTSYVTPVRPG